ncbi:MAG: hypothetical protein KKH04_07245 [Proteobacteria bacterium]|nr:hypothetical protein [Pseudomonadota bacterium]
MPGKVGEKGHDVGQFPFSWVLENGTLRMGLPLAPLLDRMGKEDIYIKGVNAIDPEGKVGVLYAGLGAGTIGRVVAASRRKEVGGVRSTLLTKKHPLEF